MDRKVIATYLNLVAIMQDLMQSSYQLTLR